MDENDLRQMPPPERTVAVGSGIPKPKSSRIARPALMRPPSASSSIGDSDFAAYAHSDRGPGSPLPQPGQPPLGSLNGDQGSARRSHAGSPRRYSEDLVNKRKLTTAHELQELRDRRLSDASEARRFSEAGISRRTSHASVILTEDTDKFMVGQRVYVGGTKPGRIMFIGEVKFAPGEFAGIVLDDPVGKNDGSVAGYKYFQCAKNHGVFSRLTRLTFDPLSPSQLAEKAAQSAASDAGLGSVSPPRQTSPTPSDRSLNQLGDLKLGDRVMVSSSTGGTKIGTLRYLGPTEFQAGDWAGIELDEPGGKNDGSVAGTRYFECRPKHGLFAPIGKVVRSPYQRRPSNTVGSPSRTGPRRGSQDSLSSLSTTSSAKGFGLGNQRRSLTGRTGILQGPSSGFQEAIKEKEVHIEQLLKEKDLERADLARAVARAEEVNQKHQQALIRLEQSEAFVADLRNQVEAIRRELEDEKRRNEDMEFRLEEQSLMMEDLKAQAESPGTGDVKSEDDLLGGSPKKRPADEEKDELLRRKDLEIYELQEANMNKEMEIGSLTAKILDLEERVKSAQQQGPKEHGPDILAIQEENESLRTICREKDNLVESLTNRVVDLEAAVTSYQQQDHFPGPSSEEFEALQLKLASKDQEIQSVTHRVKELEQDLTLTLSRPRSPSLVEELEFLQAENEALKSTNKEKEGMLEALKTQVATLESNFGNYQQELKDRVVESDQDRAAMDQLRVDLESAQNRFNQVDQKLRASEDERVELANELAQTQASFSSLEDSRKREEAKRKLLESNLEVLKEELAKTRSSYLEAQRDLEILRSQKQTGSGAREEEFLKSVIVDLQRKNDVLRKEKDVLGTKLEGIMGNPGSLAQILNPLPGRGEEAGRSPNVQEIEDEARSRRRRADEQEEITHSKHRRPRNWARPFCVGCECFGHDMNECPKQQETF